MKEEKRTVESFKEELKSGKNIKQKGRGIYKQLIKEKIQEEYRQSNSGLSYLEFEDKCLREFEADVYDYLVEISYKKPNTFRANVTYGLTKKIETEKGGFTWEETKCLRDDIKRKHDIFMKSTSVDALVEMILLLLCNSKTSVELIRKIINK